MVASPAVQPVLDAIARTAARLCEAHDALIHAVEGDSLRLIAKYGRLASAFPVGAALPLDRGWVGGRAVIDAKTVHVRDLAARKDYPGSAGAARATKARTFLATPLMRNGGATGVIVIRRLTVSPFTAKQIALLKTFADQAALAIENARLSAELGQRNRELTEALEQQTATAGVLRVISSSLTDAQPVFDAILVDGLRLCEAPNGAIFTFDGQAFRLAAAAGISAEFLAHLRESVITPGPETPLRRIGLSPRVSHVADIFADPSFSPPEAYRREDMKTLLAVPMLREGRLVGAITFHRHVVRPFTDQQIALLQTFADQALIAIENVRLFKELEARNRDLTDALDKQTATAEILRVISRSQADVQPVFEAIAESSRRLLRGWSVAVYRFDGELVHLASEHGGRSGSENTLRAYFPRPPVGDSAVARCIRDRAVVHVPDIEREPAAGVSEGTALARARGFRAFAIVPMLRDGRAIGAVSVTRAEAGAFSPAEIDLLRTFADQAVIAIENARLFTELRARNRDLTESLEQQTATSEILRVISSSPGDIQPVFDAIAANAARLCDAVNGLVIRFDGQLLHLAAHYNVDPERLAAVRQAYPRPPTRGALSGRAILTRAVVHVPDVSEDPEYSLPAATTIGYASVLAVPMMHEGVPRGTILVARDVVAPFSDAHIALIHTFADQAVIALENVRLFRELETRNRDLSEALDQQTATSELLKVIGRATFDLDPAFATLAANAVRLCEAERALIYRFDGELLRVAAAHNMSGDLQAFVEDHPIAPGRHSCAARAALERRTIHIHDARDDPEYTYGAIQVAEFRTLLAVPMLRAGDLVGVILIYRPEARPFSESQITLLETFADQAAIAIENVRLFTELQARTAELSRSVDELTALGEVSRALSSTLDLDTVLTTIVARASQLTGSDYCAVWEYNEHTETFLLRAIDSPHDEVVAAARKTVFRRGEGVQGRMAITHEPVQIPDLAAGPGFATLRDALVHTGTRALLAVPLLRDDHLIGGLTINKQTRGEFPLETVELLKTFATPSALAINNARLFREIEEQSRQLEIASRHKSQFLANMSHELRTPLNAILGYTELISDNIYGEVPERMRDVLERVDKSGRHLLGLINDILDLSKIEAGQLTLTLGPYAMDGVAQTVATQVGALAAEKSLGFEVAIADDLPIGHGDERRLTQVLLNLVGNAIKFTDAGTVTVRVTTEGDAYVVSVTDTGPGIAEADREKIFEEFQQADTTRAKAKGGTGLGLAISRRIVEMHGGRLWVESTLGEGSMFSFKVPVQVQQQVDARRS